MINRLKENQTLRVVLSFIVALFLGYLFMRGICTVTTLFALAPEEGEFCREEPSIYGWCFEGYRIPGIIRWQFYQDPGPQPLVITRATYQETGMLEETARQNGSYRLDDVECLISLMSPSTAGWKVWIKLRDPLPDGTLTDWVSCRNVDAVNLHHMYYHVAVLKSGVELQKQLADAWQITDYMNPDNTRYRWDLLICYTETDPWSVCPEDMIPTNYYDWFMANVRFESWKGNSIEWNLQEAWANNG